MTEHADAATIALLAHVDLFSECTRKELGVVARATYEIDIEPGAVLTQEGGEGHDFYVIVEGVATVSIAGEVVGHLTGGDFFGEMSLLDGGPRSATVTAESPLIVVVLPRERFEGVILAAPHVGLAMLRTLARRLRDAEDPKHKH